MSCKHPFLGANPNTPLLTISGPRVTLGITIAILALIILGMVTFIVILMILRHQVKSAVVENQASNEQTQVDAIDEQFSPMVIDTEINVSYISVTKAKQLLQDQHTYENLSVQTPDPACS